MTSLVVDVLATAGKFETAEIQEKLNDIQREITRLKNQVNDYMRDNYIDFAPRLIKDPVLINSAERLIREMGVLRSRIDSQIKVQLSGSKKELKELSHAFDEADMSLELSSKLLDLNKLFELQNNYKERNNHIKSAETLKKIEEILEDQQSQLALLDIYQPLRNAYHEAHGEFLQTISSLWEEQVYWEEEEEEEDGRNFRKLKLTGERDDLQNLIQALAYIETLPIRLHELSNKIMKCFVAPIIHDNCSVFVVEDNHSFNIEIIEKKNKHKYEIVLHNLKLLFQFIYQHFNIAIEEGSSCFLKMLGDCLLKHLSEDLLENCIADTIPSSSTDLLTFTPIKKDIQDFENYLIEIGFVPENKKFLSGYIEDVDKLYVDKISQGHLNNAREIMKKDLHDSFRYTPEAIEFGSCPAEMREKLNKNAYQLPACQVSKSTKEIFNLSRDILKEALKSSENCAPRLYYTSRNIFEVYITVVPEYHKYFLETIPQQIALFHNNCMYLAHHLMTLGYEHKDEIPEHLKKHNVTYVDLTIKLRAVGVECFLNHIKYQRNIITDILRDSGLSQFGQSSELPPSTERALRQCIRQLELLKKVWSDVLPENVYCKALGCITNSMIEDVVMRVVSLEDIPAGVATELVTLFNVLVKRAPSIFPEANSINSYVAKWQKLLELIKILEASLKDIEWRWADGKGPLAHEFTPAQVKHLIRALFQNTERRAALLSIIN